MFSYIFTLQKDLIFSGDRSIELFILKNHEADSFYRYKLKRANSYVKTTKLRVKVITVLSIIRISYFSAFYDIHKLECVSSSFCIQNWHKLHRNGMARHVSSSSLWPTHLFSKYYHSRDHATQSNHSRERPLPHHYIREQSDQTVQRLLPREIQTTTRRLSPRSMTN